LDLSKVGYSCLFKTTNKNTGSSIVIGDCATTQAGYDYTYWVRLYPTLNNLKCNNLCTNSFDNRIYSQCAKTIANCKDVPDSCNGALYGSFVEDFSNDNKEIKCEAPWNKKREKVFTNEQLNIDLSNLKCGATQTKKIPIKIENTVVNMVFLSCIR
jgi:hypothetical protein